MLESEMIWKINDPSTDLPKATYVNMSAMIEKGEKKSKSFMHETLLYQKLSLCSGIHENNFDPWHPRETQLEKHYPLYYSIIKKIYSATEHRQDLSRTAFGFEFQDVAYSLSSDPASLYHETKSDIINRLLNTPASYCFHTKFKSIIILKMCPIIRGKCFSLLDNISYFNDLAIGT